MSEKETIVPKTKNQTKNNKGNNVIQQVLTQLNF